MKAVIGSTPVAKQFTWILPVALKLPLGLLRLVAKDVARIVAFNQV